MSPGTVAPPGKKASFEADTLQLNLGPIHRQLLSYFNAYHEAVANGDEKTQRELDQVVPPLLDQFDRSESTQASNPSWAREKMRAGWHVARGEYATALEHEIGGWRHASAEPEFPGNKDARARRMSVSASNIADELRRLGKATDALPWAKISVDLWSANAVNHLVLSMVIYKAGFPNEADKIIERLRGLARFDDARDVLSKCMTYERELHEMNDLKSVRGLLEDIKRAQADGV